MKSLIFRSAPLACYFLAATLDGLVQSSTNASRSSIGGVFFALVRTNDMRASTNSRWRDFYVIQRKAHTHG